MASIKLKVHGQGVILFNSGEPSFFHIYDKKRVNGISVEFTKKSIKVYDLPSNVELPNTMENVDFINAYGEYYWFSLDSQNQRLYAGIGEPRLETATYHYQFPQETTTETNINKSFLESLINIYLDDKINILRILKDPVTNSIPLIVKNTDDLTMDDIAKGTYMPKSNLSTISQKLYDCISGKKFILNNSDFPDFSKAIERSINTPGLWCNTTLQKKSTEFNKDKPNLLETYLRITLGENNGESPGIPYVMEIWPVGHYSPIHNHAGANAIIRVLHGNIHVKLFAFLCNEIDGIEPFNAVDFKKDDITWISPTLNQTHQLVNLDTNTQTCITIQCYMYDDDNKSHYDYFDYIDENGEKQQYEPDSDMDFISFKNLMKKEWEEYLQTQSISLLCKNVK
jgi:hypothetical protein